MKLIILAVIVGTIALAVIVIYLINSGAGRARRERDEAIRDKERAEGKLRLARRALYEIAGNQSGNPVMTAISSLDEIENFEQRDVIR